MCEKKHGHMPRAHTRLVSRRPKGSPTRRQWLQARARLLPEQALLHEGWTETPTKTVQAVHASDSVTDSLETDWHT